MEEEAEVAACIKSVKFSDIAKCPLQIWSAEHWLPDHHVEVCDRDPIKRIEIDKVMARIEANLRGDILALKEAAEIKRENARREIRRR